MASDTTRVSTWDGYIGQEALKARLRIHIDAAVLQVRPLEHVLLAARAGFGKTSLARIVAQELGARFEQLTMPVSEKVIARVIQDGDAYGEYCVVFLDEIHNAKTALQEFLLPLLEFGHITNKRGRVYEATNFTIIAATTEADKLQPTLYDRFAIKPDYGEYSIDDIARIMMGMAAMLRIEMDLDTATTLAAAAGGTPRHARDFMVAARDLGSHLSRPPTAEEILAMCRVDADCLGVSHYQYLETLNLMGGTSGMLNIKTVLRLPESAVRDLELLLLQRDMIELTPGGRSLLPRGARKINLQRRQEAVT